MKNILLLLFVAAATACGGSGASAPSKTAADSNQGETSAGAAAAQGGDDSNRLLNSSECDELAGWIVQVCHEDTQRSATIEGWCSNMTAKANDGSFQSADCAKHIKVIDNMCFRTTHSSRGLMDCDRSVSRE
jgi:hypothetical protein